MLKKVKEMSNNPSKALAVSKSDLTKYESDIAIINNTI